MSADDISKWAFWGGTALAGSFFGWAAIAAVSLGFYSTEIVAALRRRCLLQVAARLHGAILLDEEMVADIIPASVVDMPAPHDGHVVVLVPVGRTAVQEYAVDFTRGSLECHRSPF